MSLQITLYSAARLSIRENKTDVNDVAANNFEFGGKIEHQRNILLQCKRQWTNRNSVKQ